MIDIFESLMDGKPEYPAAFQAARTFWATFFAEHDHDDNAGLKTAIEDAQTSFQWAMEEVGLIPPFAKSIMALTCVCALYEDGFEDREYAKRVIDAFKSSKSLSLGIGSSAEEVERLYGLS
jgi:hypothetical protein